MKIFAATVIILHLVESCYLRKCANPEGTGWLVEDTVFSSQKPQFVVRGRLSSWFGECAARA